MFFRFFLGIAVLQIFPKFSTISPGLVILPLLIVLGITAIKDGYEDIKRHQSDRKVNHSLLRVLRGGDFVNPNAMQGKSRTFVRGVMRNYGRKIKKVKGNAHEEGLVGVTTESNVPHEDIEYDDAVGERGTLSSMLPHEQGAQPEPDYRRPHWKMTAWEDLAVGDFVKILDNESIPADILICATSEDENVTFVETKSLDGETNLKSRNAVPALTHLRTSSECASTHNAFRVECDRPDVNMYKLHAGVRVGKEDFPVDMQNILLRGMSLRNTGWVIGMVRFTHKDCDELWWNAEQTE